MSDDISYEEHVQKNNQRLVSIRNSLSESFTFHSACTELTQWCSDQRAFSACFEDNLMLALQVAVENGTKDGFDFPLAHQLITTCFSHRKLLSKNSANRINRWYEQFRRLKKSGGKKKKRGETAPATPAFHPIPTEHGMDNCMDNSGTMWTQGGPMAGPSPMQSPAFGPTPGPMVPMHGYGMQPSGYPQMDPSANRPYPSGPDPNGMYDPSQIHMMQQQQRQQQHHQMMMMQQQHHAQQQPQVPQGSVQAPPPQMMTQPPAPTPAPAQPKQVGKKTAAARRRAAAAAAAEAQRQQQQQQQAAAQLPQPMIPGGMGPPPHAAGGYDPMFPVPMGVNNVPGQAQPLMRVQPGMPSPAYPGVPGPMMGPPRGHMMPMTSPGYPQANTQMIRAGPPQLFGQMQQPPQQQQVISCLNPNMVPNSFQMSFVVRAVEEVLAPFCLAHEKSISHEFFDISPELMKKLQSGNVELQLKCCHKDDTKRQAPQWPNKPGTLEPGLKVLLNDHPLQITSLCQSILVKNLVKIGKNVIEFQTFQCICSHCFSLRVVAQIPMNNVVESSLQKASRMGYSTENFKQKLMQYMQPNGLQLPLTYDRKRMSIPARFGNCMHAGCFDLQQVLQIQSEFMQLECPICKTLATLEDIEVDHFLGQVLRETNGMKPQPSEICLLPNGSWRPMNPQDPLSQPNGMVNQVPNGRKRPNDDSVNGTTMKRNKSESFHQMMKQELPPTSSPFGNANSVPAMPPMGTSPANLLSPFGGNASGFSPVKPVASPMTAKFMGGPGTPMTPGGGMMDQKPNMFSNEPQLHGNSPHQSQIQQHGSVETPSLTGSAPYTPASQSNGTNIVASASEHPTTNITSASLDIDVVDGLITTQIMSTDDLRKYLCDGEGLPTFVDVPEMKEASGYGWSNDTWDDFKQLVSDGRI